MENSQQNQLDDFHKIQVGVRVMPSTKAEHGLYIMKRKESGTSVFVGDTMSSTAYAELAEHDDSTLPFFSVSDTEGFFPPMHVDENHAPLGKGKPYCLHFDWIKKEQSYLRDQYIYVDELPTCQLATNPKSRWFDNDPVTGLDFQAWKQIRTETSSSYCSSGQIFIPRTQSSGGICYSYQYLDGICVLMKYVKHPETNSFTWEYSTGCFANGEYAHYSPAKIGETYKFNEVHVEVHQQFVAETQKGSTLGYGVAFILRSIGTLTLLASFFVGCFIAFNIYKQIKGPQGQNHGGHNQMPEENGD